MKLRRSFINLCFLLFALSPAARAYLFFGNAEVPGNATGANPPVVWGTQFTCTQNGTVNYIALWTYGGLNAEVAIYASAGTDIPGALLAHSSSQALSAGWNWFAMPATPVTAGTTYWLCFRGDAQISADYSLDSNPNRSKYYFYASYGTWETTFSAAGTGYLAFSIYATDLLMSPTFTVTVSPTRTQTPTVTSTLTRTSTSSSTKTATPSSSRTATPSSVLTNTPSPTNSPTPTATSTATPSHTPTFTATTSCSPTQTSSTTPSFTLSATPSSSRTPSSTFSASPSPSPSSSSTVSHSPTRTLSPTPSASPSSTLSSSPSSSSTPTLTPTASATASPSASRSPSPSSSITASHSPTRTLSPTPSASPSSTLPGFASPSFTSTPGLSLTPALPSPTQTPRAPGLSPTASSRAVLHSGFHVSPTVNLSRGEQVRVGFWLDKPQYVKFSFYNLAGHELYTHGQDFPPGDNTFSWDASSAGSGLCLIAVETAGERLLEKIVVVR